MLGMSGFATSLTEQLLYRCAFRFEPYLGCHEEGSNTEAVLQGVR
jgi:hypothetical protein